MPSIKYDAISLLHKGAEALARRKDGGTAYALYELANNLRLLMLEEATIAAWNDVYVGQERPPVAIDQELARLGL